MKKLFLIFGSLLALFIIHYSLFVHSAYAVCPVCTVAIAGGLGLSRWLGIDDTISGLWVGGLILSSSFWLFDWLSKKGSSFHTTYYLLLTTVFMYAFVLVPFWLGKIIGHPFNKIFGIDKLIFGTAVGSLVFLAAIFLDKKVRQIKGKQLFNYQKVILPTGFLAIISLILYFVIR